jgi:hypothetical protein
MKEGQEILTSKKKFFWRNYISIMFLSGIIFFVAGLTIELISENENNYLDALIKVFLELGFGLFICSAIYFITTKLIEPLVNKTHIEPFHYKVIYFNDRFVFKRYTENTETSDFQIFYSQIESLNQEKGRIFFKLIFGILDDSIDEREDYNWLHKGSTTSEIENQRFRISKKLSKSDCGILLEFLKIQIDRAKTV